jgi:23S rRNA (uracil1939-C5)-methyltransferase
MTKTIEPITLEVTTPVYGGECMGRLPDGRAVFVPYCLPGEQVKVELVEEKRGFARARLVEVLRPSPLRTAARCAHYGVCGGCQYQHMDYAAQLDLKREVVVDQLTRIGGIADAERLVSPVQPSPSIWNYRNTLQFHLTGDGKLGYQAWGSHQVVPIRECHLPEAILDQTWPQLEFEPQAGIERVELRTGADEEVLLALEGDAPIAPELSVELPISAVHISPSGSLILAGEDFLWMEVKGREFKVSAQSFFQVNTAQAAGMVDHLLQLLPLEKTKTVLDVYCGVGLFSAFIAPKVQRCIGVELSESACEDYAVNLDEMDNVELFVGSAEQVLPALQVQPDIVLVDPPRAGLERLALDAIAAMRPELIAYVSCDPATLARDLKRLAAAGYHIRQVDPFDMFPQTYHMETVAILQRG